MLMYSKKFVTCCVISTPINPITIIVSGIQFGMFLVVRSLYPAYSINPVISAMIKLCI